MILLPVSLVVTGSNIGQYGWIPGTSNTPPNVSKLMSPPFYMTATAKSIPGVTGSLNILQDANVTSAKVIYTDGSWTSCHTPGWIADYNPWWLPVQSGPNAQGNLICTSSDQPRLPLSTVARNQVAEVIYSGSIRDFATLQVPARRRSSQKRRGHSICQPPSRQTVFLKVTGEESSKL